MNPLIFFEEHEVLRIFLSYRKVFLRAMILSSLKNGHLAPLRDFADEERRLMMEAAK